MPLDSYDTPARRHSLGVGLGLAGPRERKTWRMWPGLLLVAVAAVVTVSALVWP